MNDGDSDFLKKHALKRSRTNYQVSPSHWIKLGGCSWSDKHPAGRHPFIFHCLLLEKSLHSQKLSGLRNQSRCLTNCKKLKSESSSSAIVITEISTDSGKLRAQHFYLGGQLYVGHKVPWVFLKVLEFIHVLYPWIFSIFFQQARNQGFCVRVSSAQNVKKYRSP